MYLGFAAIPQWLGWPGLWLDGECRFRCIVTLPLWDRSSTAEKKHPNVLCCAVSTARLLRTPGLLPWHDRYGLTNRGLDATLYPHIRSVHVWNLAGGATCYPRSIYSPQGLIPAFENSVATAVWQKRTRDPGRAETVAIMSGRLNPTSAGMYPWPPPPPVVRCLGRRRRQINFFFAFRAFLFFSSPAHRMSDRKRSQSDRRDGPEAWENA